MMDARKENIQKELDELKEILENEKDEDLKQLAREDKERLEKEIQELEGPHERMERAIVEIRPAAGGEEAALFASNLFRMYQHYAKKKDWELTILDSDVREMGGYKDVTFVLKGRSAYEKMKHEGGVHRVQRIPETEKSGRIHTSTVTVAVLPYVARQDFKINPKEIRIDVYRASGPGGQYVNKRDSAVRVTHLPTGIITTSQSSRTQVQNKENALSVMASKLAQIEREKKEKVVGAKRMTQIGTGDRSEKVRTYNFPQDRITDHRIKKSWHNIESILNGNMDPIVKALQKISDN